VKNVPKRSKMSPSDRFLYDNGFYNDFGKEVQKVIESETGKSIVATVFETDPSSRESISNCTKFILDNMCRKVKNLNGDSIEVFIDEQLNSVSGWFVGIWGDGERAYRTIQVVADYYQSYCKTKI